MTGGVENIGITRTLTAEFLRECFDLIQSQFTEMDQSMYYLYKKEYRNAYFRYMFFFTV